jgi:hypothetical protein
LVLALMPAALKIDAAACFCSNVIFAEVLAMF